MAIHILLADDHEIVRQGLKSVLERNGFTVVGEAADGLEAVRLAKERCPDVAILDFSMPFLNGIDAAQEILQASPRTKITLLTVHTAEQYVLEALRAGITGYVLKSNAVADIVQAIHAISQGRTYLSPDVAGTVVRAYLGQTDLPPDPLASRERQVLKLIAEWKTTKEVAVLLGLSVKTAESHRSRIMKKLDIHETTSLVRYAIRRGFVQP